MFNNINMIPFNKVSQSFYEQLVQQLKDKLTSSSFKIEIIDQQQAINQVQLVKLLSYFPVLYQNYSHFYISSYILKSKKVILTVQPTISKDQYKQFINTMQFIYEKCNTHIYNKIKQIQCDTDLIKELYYFVQLYFHEMVKIEASSGDIQYVYNNFPLQILYNIKTSYAKAQLFKYLVGKFKSSKICIILNEEKSQKCVNIITLNQEIYICDVSEEYFIARHNMGTYFFFLLGNKYAQRIIKQYGFDILKEFKFSNIQTDYYEDLGLYFNNAELIKCMYKFYFNQTVLQEHNEIVIPVKVKKDSQIDININQYNASFKLFSLENQINNILFSTSQVSVDINDTDKLHLLLVSEKNIKIIKFKNKSSHYYSQELFDSIFHHIYLNSRFLPKNIELTLIVDSKTYKQQTELQITQQFAYIVQDLQAFFQLNIEYEYSFTNEKSFKYQENHVLFYINMHFEEQKLLSMSRQINEPKYEISDAKENVEISSKEQLTINTQHFAYYTFISECQEVVEYIIHYAKALQKEIYIPTKFNLTQSKLDIITYCLLLDYPELWFVNISKYYYNQLDDINNQSKEQSDFIIQKLQIIPDDLEAGKIHSYNQQLVKQVQYYIKQKDISQFSLVQKEYYLHSILRHTIVYKDASLANYEFSRDIVGCFVTKQCVCQAIALGFKYLCDIYKIQCITIFGTGRNEGHAWNMVKLQDGYYHVDVTWNLQNDVYGHFNVNDQLCFMKKALTLKPWIKYPQCTSLKYNYYYIYGKYIDSLNNSLEQTVKILAKQISKQQLEKITIFYNIQVKNYSLQEWIQVNKRRVQNKLSRQLNKYYTLQNMQIFDDAFLRLDILDNQKTVVKDLPTFSNKSQTVLSKQMIHIVRNINEEQFMQWYQHNKSYLINYDIEYHTEDEYLIVQFI